MSRNLPETGESAPGSTWWLYLLKCENGYTYVGTARDPLARYALHCAGKGARFTRINRPRALLGSEPFADRSAACKAEHALKQCSREAKLDWARRWPPADPVQSA